MAGIKVRSNFPTDAAFRKMLGGVDQLKRHQVSQSTVRAGGKVVLARAKQLAPRGTAEDRNKRSKSQRAAANWDIKLRSVIAMVVRGQGIVSFAIIGPKHPAGNKAYFNQPKSGSRKHVLWGRRTSRVYTVVRNWIVQAFDETRSQQLSAMKTELKRKVHEMLT